MHRRLLISALACWPAVRLRAQDEGARPHQKISAAALHQALSARFPVRFGLAGLLDLTVSAPQLLLLPARNKIGATLLAEAAGPALQRGERGEIDLVFGLRYQAADRTIRAQDMDVLDLRLPGLPADTVQAWRSVLPRLGREVMGEVVLHRFTARELALADTMGLEPAKLTVVEDGLVVEFAPKPPR